MPVAKVDLAQYSMRCNRTLNQW